MVDKTNSSQWKQVTLNYYLFFVQKEINDYFVSYYIFNFQVEFVFNPMSLKISHQLITKIIPEVYQKSK